MNWCIYYCIQWNSVMLVKCFQFRLPQKNFDILTLLSTTLLITETIIVKSQTTKSSSIRLTLGMLCFWRGSSNLSRPFNHKHLLVMQSCFLVKRFASLVFHTGCNFSCLLQNLMMMSLLRLCGNAMSTNPPWSLSF